MSKRWTLLFIFGLCWAWGRPDGLSAQDRTKAADDEELVYIELKKAPLEGEARVSLRESVEVALERNPDLVVQKIKLEQAREKIVEEKGEYDPAFNLSSLIGRRDNVVASRFFPAGTYIEEERTQGFGLNGKVYTGARYGLSFRFQRQKSTSNTQTLSPQYAPTLTFNLTQPLLRDFGFDVNLTRIRVAQKGEEISREDLALGVSRLILQVVQAYWSLVFLKGDLEVKKTSLALAEALLRQNETLFRAGRVSSNSVQEARAGVAEREEAVIVAENEVRKGEDQLKLLLHADLATVALIPRDDLQYKAVDLDWERSRELALKRRPEIVRLEKEAEQREIDRKYAHNQTLPRLDFNAQYGMTGLSGRPNKTPVSIGGPPAGDFVKGSAFEGEERAEDAFDTFFTRHPFDNWSFELKLEIPLWNRTAKARLAQASLRLRESETALRIVRERVLLELRTASRDVLTARRRIEAARVAVQAVEEQLKGSRVRFEAGLTTSYEVLRVLDDLAQARTRELKALMDHNVAQTALSFAEGSLLEEYNVDLRNPPRFAFGGLR